VKIIFFFLLVFGFSFTALADHEHRFRHQRGHGHDKEDDTHHQNRNQEKARGVDRKECLISVNNPTYEENCGACHFAYQPELLPSRSWKQIISGLDNHFEGAIEVDAQARNSIAEYLNANAAENSSAEISAKIMRSLGGKVPSRITEIPYIRKKHHEINAQIYERESIGSPSNCPACHTTALKGIYDDEEVIVPE